MTAEKTHVSDLAPSRSSWPRARALQWALTAMIVLIAEIVFFAGHTWASYVLDTAAVGVFFAFRRRRETRI